MNLLENKKRLHEVIRYLLVAAAAYFIDMGLYVILVFGHITPLWANFCGKFLSILLSFLAHRFFTYTIKESTDFNGQALRFFGVAAVNTQASTAMLFLAIKVIADPVLAKFVCDLLLFVIGYWVTSKFVFFKRRSVE